MRPAIFVVLSAFLCRVTIWPPFPRSCERELRSSSPATDHLSAAGLLFQFWPEFAATSAEPVSVGSRSRRIGALALPCHHRLCWRVYKLCISIVRPMRRSPMHGVALPQPSVGLGAMTAALVIVPADPVCARSASAHGGRASGSSVRAVSSRTRPGPREVLSGAPWMVRLSMGCGDLTSSARLAPGQEAPPGANRYQHLPGPRGGRTPACGKGLLGRGTPACGEFPPGITVGNPQHPGVPRAMSFSGRA
jgi:hypothetical protein